MKPIASIARVNEILSKHDLKAKKQFGQNFLIDVNVVINIAERSILNSDSLVIEIGPGLGSLSEQLASRCRKLVAFEIDPNMVNILSDTMQNYPNFNLIFQDFLTANLDDVLKEHRLNNEPVYICANLPYYITTPILFKIFESGSDIALISVMMQKEVADRLVANKNTKDYNALSIIVQYLYDVKVIVKVSKNVFIPKPQVESSVVQFIKKEKNPNVTDEKTFFEIVKACFKQRRKTLYNNLRDYLNDSEKAKQLLFDLGYLNSTRAQELEIDDFIKIYKELTKCE